MTKQVQRRRGTATQHTSFTGAEGELSVNTTNKSVHVHDNVTAGGFEAARADMDNVTSSSILTAAGITATTTELNYVDGVTSAIQTQIDGKAGTASPTFTGTLTTANLTATGTTTLAGASTSADITFGDNDKAIFGAGSDLQIYHDGSNSIIKDAGTGNLKILGTSMNIQSATEENYIEAVANGHVKLFYDAAEKLATTSTGVDITGTLTSDGLTVEGNNNGGAKTTAAVNKITLKDTDVSTGQQRIGQIDWFTSDTDNAGVSASIYGYTNNTSAISSMVFATGTASSLLDRMEISYLGDISFYEDTGTTAKFFWDASAETLDIGSYVGSSVNAPLNLKSDANHHGLSIEENSGTETWQLGVDVDGDLNFHNSGNATPSVTFSDSGSVGIGTSSPSANLEISGSSNQRIDVIRTSGPTNRLSVTSDKAYVGAVTNHPLLFIQNDTERMRLDASGNLLVGTTDTTLYNNGAGGNTGVLLRGSVGNIQAARSDGAPIDLNRLDSDGDIIALQKDGITVGSIGVVDSQSTGEKALYIGTSSATTLDVGLIFDCGPNEIYPSDANGVARDAAINLGGDNERFKDLYLSGGVYLGGTGAANKLDDYEEGTWTPTIDAQTTSPTVTYGDRTGRYTKVGNMVTLWADIQPTISGGSGEATITGLPFAVTSADIRAVGAMEGRNINLSSGYTFFYVFSFASNTKLYFRQGGDNITETGIAIGNIGPRVGFTFTYMTDA